MTNEQAINIIESCDAIMWGRLTDDEEIALQMAIEALRNDIVRCKDCKFYVPEDDSRCDVIEQFDVPEMFFAETECEVRNHDCFH